MVSSGSSYDILLKITYDSLHMSLVLFNTRANDENEMTSYMHESLYNLCKYAWSDGMRF